MAKVNKFLRNPIPEPMKPGEVRGMDNHELNVLEMWYILDARLHSDDAMAVAKRRLAGIPNGWRDFRLFTAVSRKLLLRVVDTLPMRQQEHIDDMRRCGKVNIGIGSVKAPEGKSIVPDKVLDELVNAAIQGPCVTCWRMGAEIARCPLRDALLDTLPPDRLDYEGVYSECEYSRMAREQGVL